jgi:hypothetical protein
MSGTRQDWIDANQRALTAALDAVLALLERRCGRSGRPVDQVEVPGGSALDVLCARFGLSPFERDVVLLCAGIELDGTTSALCVEAQGGSGAGHPTFGLALAVLDQPHWSALVPASPLRRWRLVELDDRAPVTAAPLRIAERVLHHLTGIDYLDEELDSLIVPLTEEQPLAPSQAASAKRIAGLVSESGRPLVQICGRAPGAAEAVAAAAARLTGRPLYTLASTSIPPEASARCSIGRLWEREAALTDALLLVDYRDLDGPDPARAVAPFLDRLDAPVLVACRDPLPGLARPASRVDAVKPPSNEQREVWRAALGPARIVPDGFVDKLISQFDLDVRGILAAAAEGLAGLDGDPGAAEVTARVWEACRATTRPRMEDLAQRIVPVASWEDLVLPDRQIETLREIAAHVRWRVVVYERWGFAAKSSRGLGIAALFCGPTGTGKTMAAEVLAGELGLDLYRIDLSSVVSKYIGETEKNLRRLFDAAEGTSAILLFDEADAVFGKRTEVKDSHDRYANIEVSYLLQRMEAYRGLAILTTNLRDAIDLAFLRRIRFVIQFPFPDLDQRREIWRRVFPAATPVQGLDVDRLAVLGLAGGSIRNIGLNAAFLAADAGLCVQMEHVERAVRSEYAKLEQPLSDLELGVRK